MWHNFQDVFLVFSQWAGKTIGKCGETQKIDEMRQKGKVFFSRWKVEIGRDAKLCNKLPNGIFILSNSSHLFPSDFLIEQSRRKMSRKKLEKIGNAAAFFNFVLTNARNESSAKSF